MQNDNVGAPIDFPVQQILRYHSGIHFAVVRLKADATVRQRHEVKLLF
jgi:hypothetical protein